jgi:hypothetical protein
MRHRLGHLESLFPKGATFGKGAEFGMARSEEGTGEHGGQVGLTEALPAMRPREVVSLEPAAKYKRPAWRPSPEQKGAVHRAIIVSQRPSPPW